MLAGCGAHHRAELLGVALRLALVDVLECVEVDVEVDLEVLAPGRACAIKPLGLGVGRVGPALSIFVDLAGAATADRNDLADEAAGGEGGEEQGEQELGIGLHDPAYRQDLAAVASGAN